MLGDSFLDDLDGLGDSEEEGPAEGQTFSRAALDSDDEGDVGGGEEEVAHAIVYGELGISALRKNAKYRELMARVRRAVTAPPEPKQSAASRIQDDVDYKLVVDCNKLIHEIEDNINNTTKYVSDIYAKKFPELDSLISNKYDYIKTVERIANEQDMTLVDLNDILPSALVMIVSVTGSTTTSTPLSSSELSTCLEGCSEVHALHADKDEVLKFIEGRMVKIAPNMCAMVGTFLAAQLIGLTNGLIALSQIPATNMQLIGQEKKNLAGFSRLSSLPNTGILYYCDLVQNCPPNSRRKALKVVGNKLALAIRCDAYNNHPDGGSGRRLKEELADKFEKWNEAPKARTKKALPIPEEKPRSKRGGRRVRKFKERFAMTELRAQQNRIKMSTEEGEYSESAMGAEYGAEYGAVGAKDSGRLRAPVKKDVKFAPNKKLMKAVAASSGQTNGLSSSLVFTPVQGLELVNPSAAADRVKEANNKWFSASSGFFSAVPK